MATEEKQKEKVRSSSRGPTVVTVRPPASAEPDRAHRFLAATDALLTELVRQQLGRGGSYGK